MSIKRIKDFPDGSGSLSDDDLFIFMDGPSGGGVTKKITLSQLSAAIGGGGGSGEDFDKISFNTSLGDPDLEQGELAWNNSEGSLALGTSDTHAIFVGEEMLYRVRNNSGSTLLAGTPVYASGLTPGGNNRIEVAPYVADGNVREIRFMGLMMENCSDGVNGYATHFGYIKNIDTRGDASTNGTTNKIWASGEPSWSEGDILYVHPTVAGKLTKTEPKHSISVAIVLNRHQNQGKLFVRPLSFGHLSDNHDVNISGATNGQFLQYDSSTDYWIPSSSGKFTTLSVSFGDYLTNLVASNTTQHRTINLPDADGTVVLGGANVENENDLSIGSYQFTAGEVRISNALGQFASISASISKNRTITLPDADGTVVLNDNSGTVNIGSTTLVEGLGFRFVNDSGGLATINFVEGSSSSNHYITLPNADGTISLEGHTHTSSDITDFNSSVSGLLPVKSIVGSGNISVSSNDGEFTVSSSGLIKSDVTNISGASGVYNIVQMGQADYDALPSKDANTIYFII